MLGQALHYALSLRTRTMTRGGDHRLCTTPSRPGKTNLQFVDPAQHLAVKYTDVHGNWYAPECGFNINKPVHRLIRREAYYVVLLKYLLENAPLPIHILYDTMSETFAKCAIQEFLSEMARRGLVVFEEQPTVSAGHAFA
jgi:hypothetical protein